MPTVKKALAGMGLSSFLIMATVVAGAISTFMFRAHQLNRERLVEDLVYAKSMLRTHLKAVLADDQICGQVLNPGDPSVTVDTFDFRLGSSHGLLQVTDLTFTSTGAPGEFALAWELTQRNGLPTARKMRDSLTLQYTAATGGTPATCHLVGAPPAATNNWGSTKGQMCAKLTRFPTTPTTAALADCSFSSILAGDFPTGPTRWTLESQGVPLLGGDTMAAVRAGALSNLLVPDGSGNLPACGPGDAVYNITKPAGASPLSLECESLTGGGGLCTSPCTGAASACCLDSGPNAILYQDGVVQSSTPGGCALNFPTTAACDPSPQLGSGPGCVGPTFFCPASAPSCSAPSPCLSCCRNEGGGHRNYAGGVPVTGVLPGVCGGSPVPCGSAQAGVPAGCAPAASYYCGTAACMPIPPITLNGACQPCVEATAPGLNVPIFSGACAVYGLVVRRGTSFGTTGAPNNTYPISPPVITPPVSWTSNVCYYNNQPSSWASNSLKCVDKTTSQLAPSMGYCAQTYRCRGP